MLGPESATPKADMVMILRMPWAFIAATALALESAIMRGGEALADQGLSLTRTALRVTIMAEGTSPGVAVIAFSTSDSWSGEPFLGLVGELIWLESGRVLPLSLFTFSLSHLGRWLDLVEIPMNRLSGPER